MPGRDPETTPQVPSTRQCVAALACFAFIALLLNGPYLAGGHDRVAALLGPVGGASERIGADTLRVGLERFADDRLGRGAATTRHSGAGISVALVGNSLMDEIAGPLGAELHEQWDATVTVDTTLGGVLDDDLLVDWRAKIVSAAGASDAVYVLLSPADAPGVSDEVWRDNAASHVSSIVAELPDGTTLFWLTPPYQASGFEQRREAWNDVLRDAGRESIVTVATEPVLDGGTGTFTNEIDVDGVLTLVRDDDGIHLTAAGAELVASHIAEATFATLDGKFNRAGG